MRRTDDEIRAESWDANQLARGWDEAEKRYEHLQRDFAEFVAAIARSVRYRTLSKVVDDTTMRVSGNIGGLFVQGVAYREAVCERVVTGTREVEREEIVTPAQTRTVTATEDVVDWVCESILSSVSA
jgi:hypothetical protein